MKGSLLIALVLLSKITFAQENTAHSRQLDSLRQVIATREDSIKSLNKNVTIATDTLRKILTLPSDKINQTENYTQNKIQSGIDKIKSAASPGVQSSRNKADSLLSPLKTAKLKMENTLNRPQQELDSIQQALSSSLQRGESKVESGFTQLTGEDIDLPGIEKQSGASIPNTDLKLPDTNIQIDESLKKELASEVKLPDVKNEVTSSLGLEKPAELDQINKAELDQINKLA